jgi:hypothetical protein
VPRIVPTQVGHGAENSVLRRVDVAAGSCDGAVARDPRQRPSYFGLLAPGSKRKTSAAMFVMLGQKKRSPPKRLSWRISVIRDFRRDPLVDSHGQPMRWLHRVPARTI